MITVEATGTLDDWTEATQVRGMYRQLMPYWERHRRLMFGSCELALITETQMPSGLCQYTVAYIRVPVPRPKFDSFEQALDYLKELIP